MKFFDLCDLVGQMREPTKAKIFEIITKTFNIPIVETQRVGSSKDKIDCGCYLEGRASLRTSCPTRTAMDGDDEQTFASVALNHEHEYSLTFSVTSQSHNYLFISGGAELLKIWTDHDICSTNPPLTMVMDLSKRTRLLSLDSPTTLSNDEKADWSIVHASANAGFKNQRMCSILVKCIRNLFVCQVNKTAIRDNANRELLIPESPSRLRESLSVQQGHHVDVSALYSDRYAERSELRDPSCPKCARNLSSFPEGSTQRKKFNKHARMCKNAYKK